MSHSSTLAKMSKRIRAGYCKWAFLASLLALCGSICAETLDTSVFLRKRTVTLSGYTGNSTLTDFPVLVRLPAAVSSLCMPGGDDIRFADAAGNLLNHEVDTWNPNGESLVWVCVPSLSGTDTTLTLYYCGGQSQFVNPRLVWANADYRGVWHFSGSSKDSSTNELVCTDSSTPPTFTDAGPVGTVFSTSGSSWVTVANDPRWACYGDEMTLSGWVKATDKGDSVNYYGRIFSSKDNYINTNGFELTTQKITTQYNFIGDTNTTSGGTYQKVFATSCDCRQDYVYLSVVRQGNKVRLYANGAFVQEQSGLVLKQSIRTLRIGAQTNNGASSRWEGQLDELRLQWRAQTADWAIADYATQHNANFAVLGEEVRLGDSQLDDAPFRRACTVTFSGYAGSSRLVNFPALVRIPAGSPVYGLCAADGGDIRFADADGYAVPHEIDTWNTSGESLIWVRVPKLEGTSTTLRMFFRLKGETVAIDSHDVWKYAGYKGVWHFSGSNKESAIGLTCNNSNPAPTYTEPGAVGTAFNSVTNASAKVKFVTVVNDLRWSNYGSELTLSAWVNTRTIGTGRIFSAKQSYQSATGFEFTIQYDAAKYNTIGAGASNQQNTLNGVSCLNTFTYMTSVISDNSVTLYSNGDYSAKRSGYCPMTPSSYNMRLGASGGSSSGGAWDGMLDEMRLRWGKSSADWVAADYATQHNASFAVFGEIEDINTHGTTILFR